MGYKIGGYFLGGVESPAETEPVQSLVEDAPVKKKKKKKKLIEEVGFIHFLESFICCYKISTIFPSIFFGLAFISCVLFAVLLLPFYALGL